MIEKNFKEGNKNYHESFFAYKLNSAYWAINTEKKRYYIYFFFTIITHIVITH